eukprot:scaffold2026_cov82-Isochrysis_galbana.AAC.1
MEGLPAQADGSEPPGEGRAAADPPAEAWCHGDMRLPLHWRSNPTPHKWCGELEGDGETTAMRGDRRTTSLKMDAPG